ncbi:MAG: hypothetical protein SGJ27_08120 [Candidatus Melainabacteria bacterium]|nr:hypothetical protein [Candidatus Melainabacteria bacterium]
MSSYTGFTTAEMVALKATAGEQNTDSDRLDFAPTFAKVPQDLFAERLPRRHSDNSTAVAQSVGLQPQATAVPTSLSIDDVTIQVTAFNLKPIRPAKSSSPRATLVDTPSIVDGALLDRRIIQLDVVMRDLEQSKDFWNRAELLLQDSWLNGYKGTFYEQKECHASAAECYKRALKLYALALKLDRMTSKSSHHIISFYHLLRRYASVLSDPRMPSELQDAKTVSQLVEQMEIIRNERAKWGMSNPENEDEPFAYAGTVLKVLCV